MKTTDWENLIRERTEKSGLPLREIERLTGVSSAQLSRFMRGERGLTITTAQKLAGVIGLNLTETEPEKTRKRGRK